MLQHWASKSNAPRLRLLQLLVCGVLLGAGAPAAAGTAKPLLQEEDETGSRVVAGVQRNAKPRAKSAVRPNDLRRKSMAKAPDRAAGKTPSKKGQQGGMTVLGRKKERPFPAVCHDIW